MESKDSDNIIDPESVLTLDYIPADLFQKTNKNITKNNSNNNSKKLSKINESNTNSSKTPHKKLTLCYFCDCSKN